MTVLVRPGANCFILTAPHGRELGRIYGRTYVTERSKKHYFIKFDGFGVSEEVLEILLKYNVEWIVFNYKCAEEGKHEQYRVSTLRIAGLDPKEFGFVDKSWSTPDPQIIIPREFTEKKDVHTTEAFAIE